ncbi:50S ribosomal protein L24 [Thiohalorhabdus methylotrophus]|uniref:Large ribosomal subunit protein uL24 n=1 Tax=Thiohalorhabdus methylotrophus TaxID=3242694 RepID=A0ABV4TU54_9GAMM
MQRIKKGDDVVVRSGKDAGKRGTVQRVLSGENRVVVANANMVKRHVRPNPQAGIAGGIQEREAPLDMSKVNPFCRSCDKGVRVGFKTLEDGRKVRMCRSCGEALDS